ncbi:hypothetical protein OSB04_006234 [Centaurea solstitialis]|uniref:Reverse transcriptase domain-containing protein n=1 Tax=Centaurea solstitialis TaxID=347529 RepID=A0AA38THJ4_9ASTR|nr:hypothetical protein OSB04_006234 [Centaurea solstitialis]
MIFKVDFEKAYDTVEWSFLLEGLDSMGFGEKWRKWIKACLHSSRISVLVNGSPTEEFPMERGLRQGDPLAPFLFLIVAECLHLLIENAEEKGLFKGIKVGKDDVKISHLQYADDIIFFGEWELGNFLNLLKILECFHLVSGLKINLQKSKLFGVGVKLDEVQNWASRLGCGSGNLPFVYLGLPVAKWWWRFHEDGDALWVKVIRSIFGEEGGISNRGEVRCRGGSVWSSIIRVGREIDELGINFSNSIGKEVGNGESIRFWEDSWITGESLKNKFERLYRLESNKRVLVAERGEFLGEDWRWKWDWRREPRGRERSEFDELQNLLKEVHPKRGTLDRLVWRRDPLNGFSVKVLRGWIEEDRGRGREIRDITPWLKAVPKKICIFAWRSKLRRLPVRVELANRGIDLDNILCPRCGSEEETVDHALIGCSKIKQLWKFFGNWWNLGCEACSSLEELWELGNIRGSNGKGAKRWLATTWCFMYLIWSERNKLVFGHSNNSIEDLGPVFQRKSFEWTARRDKELALDWNLWLTDPFGGRFE